MNKTILIASAVTAGATALFYFLRKRKASTSSQQMPAHHSRHMTDVFAKAKQG